MIEPILLLVIMAGSVTAGCMGLAITIMHFNRTCEKCRGPLHRE